MVFYHHFLQKSRCVSKGKGKRKTQKQSHFPESKRKIGKNAPPFHPWCRCTTAPYFEDMKGVGERWMRNPETGKGGYVPADMTYQVWKAKYIDKTGECDIIYLRTSNGV